MSDLISSPPIQQAASMVLIRKDLGPEPHVLMGQRGVNAVFMPSKYVFPGGRLDAADDFQGPLPLDALSQNCMQAQSNTRALIGCALRELAEETGQKFNPAALLAQSPLQLIFRAITPPKRPRRFDAWFFMADAAHLASSPDDFSQAEDELSHLHWITLTEAQRLDLPFITEVILAEAAYILRGGKQQGVPFFDNSEDKSVFRRMAQ